MKIIVERLNRISNWQKILLLILLIFSIEIFSFSAFFLPTFALSIFILLNLSFLLLAIKKIEFAIFVIFSELIVSSMGHMFFLDLGGFRLSIRMTFWLILLLVFCFKFIIQFYKSAKDSVYWQRIRDFKFLKVFCLLALFITLALFRGLLLQNSFSSVFNDFNSWLFFILIIPVLAVIDLKKEKTAIYLKNILLASFIYLSLKTLILLGIFSHNLEIASSIYTWLRGTLMAEITVNSFWSRIFMQSQIFSGLAFFLVFVLAQKNIINLNLIGDGKEKVKAFFNKDNLVLMILAGLFLSTLILSFSRSFWLALVIVIFFSLILFWIYFGFKNTLKSAFFLVISFALALFLIYFVSILPISSSDNLSFNKGLSERISQDSKEPALASRWSLLPVLWSEIKTAPILGKGFGFELSYISSDPRVLERNPSGEYKTSAFEWGYLDIWLKMGVFGLFVYFLLLTKIIFTGFKEKLNHSGIFWAFSLALMFLAILNFFTPYLNHPLGIGLIIISTCIIQENEVYLKKNKSNI